MPSVTYNGQSFALDGRRIWVLGASIQYARIPADLWAARIAAAKQAGFNTIETACLWLLHEPRKGRHHFQGDADLRRFVSLCGEMGMRVVLRAGPYVGEGFDGGGLPGWLLETPGVMPRQANEAFLEHVSRYFRKLLGEVSDLQATDGGPILLVQSEHAWTCSNELQAEKYLHEVTRIIRESGINVPILNANDLWQESPGTIDTWRGEADLLVNLRQLRSVQPTAPRLVTTFNSSETATWACPAGDKPAKGKAGSDSKVDKTAEGALRHLAEILAAGAQPIVSPFHGGTNFGFLGGRLAGEGARFVTTAAAAGAPLGEAGHRGDKYRLMKRLVTFANHFSNLFAELDPDFHPAVLDPAAQGGPGIAVPVRGSQGGVVFIFNGAPSHVEPTLVLDNGVRLPVHMGDQPVGWFAVDADLQGVGKLDFANLMAWGLIDRSVLVLFGPAKAGAYLSINGSPLEATVPAAGSPPTVVEHQGLTVVICNFQQIDATYHSHSALYIGVGGLGAEDRPILASDWPKAWVIRKGGSIEPVKAADSEKAGSGKSNVGSQKSEKAPALGAWQQADLMAYASGQSPRFASLDGPEPLSICGAPWGYGWYRMTFAATAGKRMCLFPEAADRLHVFVNGECMHRGGVGPGVSDEPFELKLGKGQATIVVLADNFGRFSEGNDLAQRKGVWGHLQAVKPLKAAKPKTVKADPVDPFKLRGFIAGRSQGQVSESEQIAWTFDHPRKTPIVVDVRDCAASGTFVLNNEPISYFAGATGGCSARLALDPATLKPFRRGKNVLRFAPDPRQDKALAAVAAATTLYECAETLSGDGEWSFAKWEAPAASSFRPSAKAPGKSSKGFPCWWRTTFEIDASATRPDAMPLWIDLAGLTKGQAFINGQNLGRYFTATPQGKPVGPQTRLYVPSAWLKPGPGNELLIFDEHGWEPTKSRLVRSAAGSLD